MESTQKGELSAETQRKQSRNQTCDRGFGFAAGCWATALPRQQRASLSGFYPWFGFRPFGLLRRVRLRYQLTVETGQSPNQGRSPTDTRQSAGHSRRLTSGGEAVAEIEAFGA